MVSKRKFMDNFSNEKLILTVKAGADFYKCIREAVILSLQENRQVEFTFNDLTCLINPSDILSFIAEKGE